MRTLRRTPLLLPLLAAFAACGPKRAGPGPGAGTAGPHASAVPTPIAWAADARAMLSVGMGAGRPTWGTPLKPGEKVTWFVTTDPPSSMRRVTVVHDAADPVRWQLSRAPAAATLEIALESDDSHALSIAWSTSGAAPAVVSAPGDLAAMWTPPVMLVDSSFTAAGGTFVGNEVVRVPAGVFRARHALLRRDGVDWHLYVTHGVPGGLVKVERFPEGSSSASMVIELDAYTRVRGEHHPR